MLKIGEFSWLSQVTVRALRYYDEIGLLKPRCRKCRRGWRGLKRG
jgi:DNA-binding transcriptional MerR regulator